MKQYKLSGLGGEHIILASSRANAISSTGNTLYSIAKGDNLFYVENLETQKETFHEILSDGTIEEIQECIIK